MTLIALCGLTPEAVWSTAERRRCTVTKGIMDHLEEHYGTDYAPNTRETFRRQVLHQFVQAGVAEYNPFEPGLSTNSPRAHYAVTEAVLHVVRRYGTEDWQPAVDRFRRHHGVLVERYARDRERMMVAVRVPDGWELRLSPGRHNEVQRAGSRTSHRALPLAPTCFISATRPRRTCSSTMSASPSCVFLSPTTTSCPTSYCTTPNAVGCSSSRR